MKRLFPHLMLALVPGLAVAQDCSSEAASACEEAKTACDGSESVACEAGDAPACEASLVADGNTTSELESFYATARVHRANAELAFLQAELAALEAELASVRLEIASRRMSATSKKTVAVLLESEYSSEKTERVADEACSSAKTRAVLAKVEDECSSTRKTLAASTCNSSQGLFPEGSGLAETAKLVANIEKKAEESCPATQAMALVAGEPDCASEKKSECSSTQKAVRVANEQACASEKRCLLWTP